MATTGGGGFTRLIMASISQYSQPAIQTQSHTRIRGSRHPREAGRMSRELEESTLQRNTREARRGRTRAERGGWGAAGGRLGAFLVHEAWRTRGRSWAGGGRFGAGAVWRQLKQWRCKRQGQAAQGRMPPRKWQTGISSLPESSLGCSEHPGHWRRDHPSVSNSAALGGRNT